MIKKLKKDGMKKHKSKKLTNFQGYIKTSRHKKFLNKFKDNKVILF
jgi:hypothetical protein